MCYRRVPARITSFSVFRAAWPEQYYPYIYMNTPKELHNSLYRVVSVYGLSLLVDGLTGFGPIVPTVEWKLDLLHDMVSLMIYRKIAAVVAPRLPLEQRGYILDLLETVMLTVLTATFAGRPVDPQFLILLLALVVVYHHYLKAKLMSYFGVATENSQKYESTADMVQTILLLSTTDPSPYSLCSKLLAVFVYHQFLKL